MTNSAIVKAIIGLCILVFGWLFVNLALYVLAGACLFFNQGGAIAWVFTVTGILLIVEGVMELVNSGNK